MDLAAMMLPDSRDGAGGGEDFEPKAPLPGSDMSAPTGARSFGWVRRTVLAGVVVMAMVVAFGLGRRIVPISTLYWVFLSWTNQSFERSPLPEEPGAIRVGFPWAPITPIIQKQFNCSPTDYTISWNTAVPCARLRYSGANSGTLCAALIGHSTGLHLCLFLANGDSATLLGDCLTEGIGSGEDGGLEILPLRSSSGFLVLVISSSEQDSEIRHMLFRQTSSGFRKVWEATAFMRMIVNNSGEDMLEARFAYPSSSWWRRDEIVELAVRNGDRSWAIHRWDPVSQTYRERSHGGRRI